MSPRREGTARPDETGRLAAVRSSALLDTPPDGAFDRVTRLAARLLDVPIAVVGVVDREPGLWAAGGAADPRTLDDPLVRDELGLRFHAEVPLRTSDGRTLGALSVLDAQPRELTAEELGTLEDLAAIAVEVLELRLAAREEAARLTRVQGDFLAVAAHELRSPLAAVYGAAQLLGRTEVGDELRRERLRAVIAEESERLSAVVTEILAGAELQAGRAAPAGERCDPLAIARSAVEAARVHLPDRLSLELDPGEAPELESDSLRIRQILDALIENAVKYSPGGGAIEVGVGPRDGGVRFRVSDEGIGIPAADEERIFERFVRLDARLTRGVGGTGLGLYIARELARELGGSLAVLARAGTGSTFVLDLPAAPHPAST